MKLGSFHCTDGQVCLVCLCSEIHTCTVHCIILTSGTVEVVDGTNITVKFMKRCGKKYSWPSRPDVQTLPTEEILCIIEKPPRPSSQHGRQFIIDNAAQIDELQLKQLDD